MSQIAAVHVEAGDAVRAGQLLVELDDRDLASALRAAEAARAGVDAAVLEAGYALEAARADLGLAETTHERFTDLLERRSVSRQEYDEVAARLQGARASVQMAEARGRMAASSGVQMDAQLDAARAAVSYTRLTAPMDGIVTARHVDAGSLASPGVPLLTLEGVGALELEVSPPASLLPAVTVGQRVPVIFDGPVETTGEIVEIVPTVDPASRTFMLTVALPAESGLRTGMFGRARLAGTPRERLTVPAAAVVERGQVQTVFVVEAGVARRQLVSLGGLVDADYEVLSGLVAGDVVVLEPSGLTDGRLVTMGGA